jgi:hypothetical protein
MTEAFNALFDTYAAFAMESQMAFEEMAAGQAWEVDVEEGTLTVGPFTSRTQVLASYSQVSGTLLWAWARERELGEGWPEQTTLASKHIASLGEEAPELSEGIAKLTAEEADDAVLIGVALLHAAGRKAVEVDAPAFYRGDHAQGSIYLLVDSGKVRFAPKHVAMKVLETFPKLVAMGMPFTSVQRAFESYASMHGMKLEADAQTVTAKHASGTLTARFDEAGRLEKLDGELV